jgi:hypothetical protein
MKHWRKPIKTDLGGLLGLIMFGGIDAEETVMIMNAYPNLPPNPSNYTIPSRIYMHYFLESHMTTYVHPL